MLRLPPEMRSVRAQHQSDHGGSAWLLSDRSWLDEIARRVSRSGGCTAMPCPQQLPGDPASPARCWRAYPSTTAFRRSGVNSCPMSRPASYGPSKAGRRTSFCESGIAVGRIKSSHRGKSSSFLPQPSRETEKALWLPKSRRRSLPRLSSEL